MRKKLTAIGNSFGIVIEKPVLELLSIDRDTELEVTTDGQKLIIQPVPKGPSKDITEATARVMRAHDRTLKKLAK
jgi:antitoxin MazE